MNKKKIGFFGILLSSFFANLILVYAQNDFLNDWLRFIFIDLSDLAESGDQIFIVYFSRIEQSHDKLRVKTRYKL